MKNTFGSLLSLIFVATGVFAAPTAEAQNVNVTGNRFPSSIQKAPQSKKDMIARLKTLQEKQASELSNLETAIRKQLQESMSLNVAKEDSRYASRQTGELAKKIDQLNNRRSELKARREIIDRLVFAIDSKYSNQPLQGFLEQQFLEMASTDLSEGRDSRMWKAFTYLSIAIREVPEAREDMFAVIEGYMNFSNVLEPKTPAEFLASRNYTNGAESAQAKVVNRSDLGDALDAIEANTNDDAKSLDQRMANIERASAQPLSLELKMSLPGLEKREARATAASAKITSATAIAPNPSVESLSGTSRSAESAPVEVSPN